MDDLRNPVAKLGANRLEGWQTTLVLDRVMKKPGDCLVLVATVFHDQGGDTEQVRHVRNASAFAVLKKRLTAREQEVATLLAYGLSNRRIAEQLVVTARTVAAHIEHILHKLGFASRHQVGTWAAEHGLPDESATRIGS